MFLKILFSFRSEIVLEILCCLAAVQLFCDRVAPNLGNFIQRPGLGT